MTVTALHPPRASTETRLEAARQAASRARRLQAQKVNERVVEVLPGLAEFLVDGGLRPGATYSVDGSTALVSALLAKPSSDGLWCAVVGLPGFSSEAAAGLGCDLEHLVLVPYPGRDWVNVVAALVDALPIVVIRPPAPVADGAAARLSARLRQYESVLIACGSWPRAEMRLTVTSSRWAGLGEGHGHLSARHVTIAASGRGTNRLSAARETKLWLPDPSGAVRVVEGESAIATGRASRSIDESLHEAVG